MFKCAIMPGGLASPEIELHSLPQDLKLFNGRLDRDTFPDGELDIHVVNSVGQRNLACQLLNRMYGWRGYRASHMIGASDKSETFAASLSGDIVGTLTLTVDSPDGLAADQTFGDVIEKARSVPHARLCELTKFASQPSNDSKHFLAALFHTIFIYGTARHGCTDLFIEVNPRHVRFYEVMLGFVKVGGVRTNEAVHAPAQLMRLKVADIGRHIELYAKQDDRPIARSLYPFFLSAKEEEAVRMRMAGINPLSRIESEEPRLHARDTWARPEVRGQVLAA